MKIRNRHQRTVAAPPEPIAALVSDFDRVWPAEIVPAPRPQGGRRYDAGLMLWRDRIEPLHNRILEALLDNVEAAVAFNIRREEARS
jgi:hypothetical protein